MNHRPAATEAEAEAPCVPPSESDDERRRRGINKLEENKELEGARFRNKHIRNDPFLVLLFPLTPSCLREAIAVATRNSQSSQYVVPPGWVDRARRMALPETAIIAAGDGRSQRKRAEKPEGVLSPGSNR